MPFETTQGLACIHNYGGFIASLMLHVPIDLVKHNSGAHAINRSTAVVRRGAATQTGLGVDASYTMTWDVQLLNAQYHSPWPTMSMFWAGHQCPEAEDVMIL